MNLVRLIWFARDRDLTFFLSNLFIAQEVTFSAI
jgi:hypothetical protein